MMETKIQEKLKSGLEVDDFQKDGDIYLALNPDYISGDNAKYMTMYNRFARWYDLSERWLGALLYGKAVDKLRRELMAEIEWKDHLSVLYVSIGTGQDLRYIPKNIDLKSLDFVGADISIGMLKKCQKSCSKKTNLQLFHACAEDLPFADNSFDIVYHIGGINFFTDKTKAMQEMLRVAKPGTKILISDETADYVDQQYKKNHFSKDYFKDATVDLGEIEAAVPAGVKEKELKFLWDGKFYALTFRK